jgi:hypothetical protein
MWYSQAQGILFVMSALLTLGGINKTYYYQLTFKCVFPCKEDYHKYKDLWLEPTGVEPLLDLFSNVRVLV